MVLARRAEPSGEAARRIRRLVRRVLAGVLALVAVVPFFGLIDLGTLVGLADPSERWPVPLEASWGGLFTFLLGGAYLWLALAREPRGATLQLLLVAVALVVAGVVGKDPGPIAVAAGVATSLLVLWLLDPRALRPWPKTWSVRLRFLLLAMVALPIWVPYSLAAFAKSRAGAEGDVTNGIEHWPVQGAAGIALLLGAIALALWGPTPVGSTTVVLTATVIAAAALAYPDRIGATEGRLWAVATLVWAALVALMAARPLRRILER